jgi:hypothetical protein
MALIIGAGIAMGHVPPYPPDQHVEQFARYSTIVFFGLLGLVLVWYTPKSKPEKSGN